jgi:hypothetical protein
MGQVSNRQSAIKNRKCSRLSAAARLPRNVFDFQTVAGILGRFNIGCKQPWRFAPWPRQNISKKGAKKAGGAKKE